MTIPQTSGNYEYSQSAIRIITTALRVCQVIGDNETPDGAMLDDALDAFNAMIKGWQASGIHVWSEEEAILFPDANKAQYEIGTTSQDHACVFRTLVQTTLSAAAASGASTISVTSASGIVTGYYIGVQTTAGTNFWTTVNGAPSGTTVTLSTPLDASCVAGAIVFCYPTPLVRPLRLYSGRRYVYSSGIETSMIQMSRLDYANQPNKTTTGTFTAYFFDPQTGPSGGAYIYPQALLNFWPEPQDNTNGFRFTSQRPLQTLDNLSNLPDFPPEWIAALKWNLAVEIAPQYAVPAQQMQMIAQQATRWFTVAQAWDREPEGIRFGFAAQPAYRR